MELREIIGIAREWCRENCCGSVSGRRIILIILKVGVHVREQHYRCLLTDFDEIVNTGQEWNGKMKNDLELGDIVGHHLDPGNLKKGGLG